MDGWIKIHRKMLENPIICKDGDYLAVWVYLLLNATHKNKAAVFRGEKIILSPGQLITGRKSISETLNIHESKIQRILKSFENEQQITQDTANRNRLISILNWNVYQSKDNDHEQLMNNNQTADEQPVNTNKNDKNIKKEKNKDICVPKGKRDNSYTDNFELFWKEYPRKISKQSAFRCWKARLKEKEFNAEQLIESARKYREVCQNSGTDEKFIKHASTFLGPDKHFMDYVSEKIEQETVKDTIKAVEEIIEEEPQDFGWDNL